MGVIIRADGSPALGLGHLLRTLAVVEEAAERGLPVGYVSVDDPVLEVVTRRGFPVRRISDPADVAWVEDLEGDDIVLLDGYHLPPDVRRAVRRAGLRVGAVIDAASGPYDLDVLIDPSPGADGVTLPTGATLLSGPRAALIRREFRARRRRRTEVQHVVVVLGGSDPAALTLRLIDTLVAMPAVERVTAVVGPATAVIGSVDADGVEIVVDPIDPAAVFDVADLAVASASTVTWELLSMGIPVVAVQVAENQREVARFVDRAGVGRVVDGSDPDVATRVAQLVRGMAVDGENARRSEIALAAVDGRGAERAITALLKASAT